MSFYLNSIVYYVAGAASVLFVLSYFYPGLFRIGGMVLLLLLIAVVIDAILVYSKLAGLNAERLVSERFFRHLIISKPERDLSRRLLRAVGILRGCPDLHASVLEKGHGHGWLHRGLRQVRNVVAGFHRAGGIPRRSPCRTPAHAGSL